MLKTCNNFQTPKTQLYQKRPKIRKYYTSPFTSIRGAKGSWLHLVHVDDGYAGCICHELFDTISKRSIRIPCENISDFLISKNDAWIGSNNGISKIDINTNNRVDYKLLPITKEIISLNEFEDRIIYLDKYFGLFQYNYTSESVSPFQKINEYSYSLDLQFTNSLIIDNCIYIIGVYIDPVMSYTKGKTLLLKYNLETKSLNKFEFPIPYLEKLDTISDIIIAYGTHSEGYEGGDVGVLGGLLLFDYKNDSSKLQINYPIIQIEKNDSSIIAKTIMDAGFTLEFKETYIKLDSLSYSIRKSFLIAGPDAYNPNDPETDSVNIGYSYKIPVDHKKYSKYANEYKSLKAKRITDTRILREQSVKFNQIRIEREPFIDDQAY
jgi:hypothetical protein